LSGSYVLDTNVLLHLIRGQALGTKIDQAFGLTSSLHRQIVSIVTQAELWVIADRKGWGDAKRDALQHALDNLVIIPVDGTDVVEAYVRIAHADAAAGEGARNMGKNDIWIAATALYAQLPLLTTDKDFRFLHDDLLQVMWIDPSGI
jgi:tRNA(fMet)-specific endonuclease VapC